jgi:hypothetical protein
VTGIPDLVSHVSLISVPAAGITIMSHLISMHHDTLEVVGHRSSTPNLSSSHREEETAKQPLNVLASQELPLSGTISGQPAREPAADTHSHISNAQLTDNQIDFVNSLWSANVPATDIARLMKRIRVTGGQGSGIREMCDGDHPYTAPPSYDGLGSGVSEER